MKTISLPPAVNIRLLTEELFAAFPEWIRPSATGPRTDVVIDDGTISFPDETPTERVQAVIVAHDPAGKSVNQKRAETEEDARTSYRDLAEWLREGTYEQAETFVSGRVTNGVTLEQAQNAIQNAANLADVKVILQSIVRSIYGVVDVLLVIVKLVIVIREFVVRIRR